MKTASSRFMQWLRAGIATDEESRDGLGKRVAQPRNCFNPGLAIRQAKIRNDQIRRLPLASKGSEGAAARISGYDTATPAAQQSASAVEHPRVVIDDDNELAVGAINRSTDRRW